MSTKDLQRVHPLLSDRVRLMIMVHLSIAGGPVDFTSLLAALELTKGNLSTHLRKLEEATLISVNKEFIDRKPRTTYACTSTGRQDLQTYLNTIESLLKQVR
ncbi:transcriptional regulator [Undibacterium sp. Tian12W]|uniref:transcriptional regulator n=1 Tax=Undibacterium sp. Tian12W TaxID=3413054 RepID=UPI003BF3C0D4